MLRTGTIFIIVSLAFFNSSVYANIINESSLAINPLLLNQPLRVALDFNETVITAQPGGKRPVETSNVTPPTTTSSPTPTSTPTSPSPSPSPSGSTEPAGGFGVLLTNADTVPIPSFLEHKAFILATNNLIYLKGSLNVDGNLCALMADNVVILSKNFKFETSKTAVKPSATASIIAAPSSNEAGINAAFFIAGRRPLPYLENWSGKTISIKGSVASLYRRHIKDVVENPSLFTLPSTFTFCHNYKFCNGELYHPLIPVVRSYRIREKRAITEAEYNSGQ
jgi:hypothetical protein